jgi:hypothetical protein
MEPDSTWLKNDADVAVLSWTMEVEAVSQRCRIVHRTKRGLPSLAACRDKLAPSRLVLDGQTLHGTSHRQMRP